VRPVARTLPSERADVAHSATTSTSTSSCASSTRMARRCARSITP
jgi:hypothetical protein